MVMTQGKDKFVCFDSTSQCLPKHLFFQSKSNSVHLCVCMRMCASVVKECACNGGDLGSIPGSGRSPGEGNGYPLQYSCLEIPMDRGPWQATVHGVTKRHDWVTNSSTNTRCMCVHVCVWNLVCMCNIGSLSPGICPQSLFEKGSCEAVVRFPSSLLCCLNPLSSGWRHMGVVSTVNLQHELGLI